MLERLRKFLKNNLQLENKRIGELNLKKRFSKPNIKEKFKKN